MFIGLMVGVLLNCLLAKYLNVSFLQLLGLILTSNEGFVISMIMVLGSSSLLQVSLIFIPGFVTWFF